MNGMKKNKVLVQNSITYAIVIACWSLVQILGATGHMTSLLKGLDVYKRQMEISSSSAIAQSKDSRLVRLC